jgi:hypothetical protein
MTEHVPSKKWSNCVDTNIDVLRNMVNFAYETGYHEMGYDVVSELVAQLRAGPEPPAALPEPPDGRADTAHRCVTLADKLLAERGYMPESSVRHQLRIALSCITDLQRAMQPPGSDAEDAARWRALIGCARVRVLGTSGIYRPNPDGFAHIGVEFWTKHPTPSTSEAIEDLTNFATIAAGTRPTKGDSRGDV